MVSVSRRILPAWARLLAVGCVVAASTAGPVGAQFPGEESVARSESPVRPNILWLIAQNIAPDLGCYGEKLIETLYLDRLAVEGVRFTRVFATSPVCAPSRSAFMTGMYQTSTDTHHMRSHRDDDFRLPPGVRPLTHRLRDAGYFTANIKTIGEHVVGTGKLDLNFVNEGPIYDSEDWSALRERQPFFATVNLPEVEYDIYDRQSADKPRVEWVGEREHPQIATPENVTPPPYYPDHPITRQEWARYLNSISGMVRVAAGALLLLPQLGSLRSDRNARPARPSARRGSSIPPGAADGRV
jgi:arylsulfatase A-like enzyme